LDKIEGNKPIMFPLWEIMSIFGKHTAMGLPTPFVTNEIEILPDK
jgi:hypothetical protein